MMRAMAGALVVALLAACAGADDESSPSEASATIASSIDEPADPTEVVSTTAAPATTAQASADSMPTQPSTVEVSDVPDLPDLGRIVALGEEAVLADLLALGFEPIASTVTVGSAGVQGIDDPRVAGIETFEMTSMSLEALAATEPDTIVTYQFWVDQIGADVLEPMADLIIIPDGLSGVENLQGLAELVGIDPGAVDDVVAELDSAKANARAALGDDCRISLAAVYAGPNVAAFVDGPWAMPSTLLDLGCEFVPGADLDHDQNGRAWLSEEQYGLLGASPLVLMQSDAVEGEAESLVGLDDHPVWSQLPAVASGDVLTVDRLGYPGVDGELRFIEDFVAAMTDPP